MTKSTQIRYQRFRTSDMEKRRQSKGYHMCEQSDALGEIEKLIAVLEEDPAKLSEDTIPRLHKAAIGLHVLGGLLAIRYSGANDFLQNGEEYNTLLGLPRSVPGTLPMDRFE